MEYNREKTKLKSMSQQRDFVVATVAAERGIVLSKEIENLQTNIYNQRGWEPLQDVDDTVAGINYINAKANLDEILKYGRDGYYDMERTKDPETGLTDEQIKKELDELNQQIQVNGFDSQIDLFSQDCSNIDRYDYVPKNQPKYSFEPSLTEGAKEFVDIRKNEARDV